jgi:Transcriptional regulators
MKNAASNISLLNNTISRSVSKLHNLIRNNIAVKFNEAGLDITLEMYVVLRDLWEQDGRNQQDLADKLNRDKASLTNIINNLEKRDLVIRKKNRKDSRSNYIFLTQKGKKLQNTVVPIVMNLLDEMQQHIPPEDVILTKKVLDSMIAVLAS